MRIADGLDNRSFSDAIDDELTQLWDRNTSTWGMGSRKGQGRYVEHGLYQRQIEYLLRYISWCNLHLIFIEKLKSEQAVYGEMARLFCFLGLTPGKVEFHKYNVGEHRAITRSFNTSLVDWDWNSPAVIRTRRNLHEFFTSENEKLYEFIGKRIEEWQ